MGSFSAGSPPNNGSLGKILRAYQTATGADLLPQMTSHTNVDFIDFDVLPAGMLIGRVKTSASSVFSSLWVVQLPNNYDHNGLAALYTSFKRNIHKIIATSNDQTLTMPLIGVLPSAGVTPADVIEEVISLLNHVASLPPTHGSSKLQKICLFMHKSSVDELQRKIQRAGGLLAKSIPGFDISSNSISSNSSNSSLLRELNPSLLPVHLDQLSTELDSAALALMFPSPSLSALAKSLASDSMLREAANLIVTTHKVVQKYENPTDENVQRILVFTICLQGRRILERFCRIASGDMRMNAGFKDIDSLVSHGKMSQDTAEQARKIIRNGNKAAHTDCEGATLTASDGHVTLTAIFAVIADFPQGAQQTQVTSSNTGGSVLPGDWICMSCKKNNFASRTQCFACALPRGQQPVQPQQLQQQEQVPFNNGFSFNMANMQQMQFQPQIQQQMQPQPQPQPQQQVFQAPPQQPQVFQPLPQQNQKPGDWTCACGSLNFASRVQCYKCNSPKQQLQQVIQQQVQPLHQPQQVQPLQPNEKPGDWTCNSCGKLNFASRSQCFQCNLPKQQQVQQPHVQVQVQQQVFQQQQQPQVIQPLPQQPQVFQPLPQQNQKPGDWTCACGSLNFASRVQCYKCNSPKQQLQQQVQQVQVHQPLQVQQQQPLQQVQSNERPGDWTCTCGSLNFASRVQCYKCNSPKQQLQQQVHQQQPQVQQPQSGFKSGDWNCPSCGKHNFASRSRCFQCNAFKQ